MTNGLRSAREANYEFQDLVTLNVGHRAFFLHFRRTLGFCHQRADQPTIQAGIDQAVNGDTVLVGPGTYNEAINFNGKAITLQSSDGPGKTVIDASDLDASVVNIPNPSVPDVNTISGFTISGGKGTLIVPGFYRGGGFHITGGTTKIVNCTITQNDVHHNLGPGTGTSGTGGGVSIDGGTLTMIDCAIHHNSAFGNPSCGGLPSGGPASGGGIWSSANLTMLNCSVTSNTIVTIGCMGFAGPTQGGGLFLSGTAKLVNCTIHENSANGTNGSAWGAGIHTTGITELLNCRVTSNLNSGCCEIPPVSVGISNSNSGTLTLRQCTVANNSIPNNPPAPPWTSGGVYNSNSAAGSVVIFNSVLFGNAMLEIGGQGSAATVGSTSVEGGYPGAGNISSDPQFVDATNGDFRLADGSPCIDTANVADLPPDTFDLDGDGNTTERIPYDLDGLRRVVNGFVDMGAYEWQHECIADVSPSSPGVAGDGTVNIADLLAIIASWGECNTCVADVNADDVVNVLDLLDIVGAWGRCP